MHLTKEIIYAAQDQKMVTLRGNYDQCLSFYDEVRAWMSSLAIDQNPYEKA